MITINPLTREFIVNHPGHPDQGVHDPTGGKGGKGESETNYQFGQSIKDATVDLGPHSPIVGRVDDRTFEEALKKLSEKEAEDRQEISSQMKKAQEEYESKHGDKLKELERQRLAKMKEIGEIYKRLTGDR